MARVTVIGWLYVLAIVGWKPTYVQAQTQEDVFHYLEDVIGTSLDYVQVWMTDTAVTGAEGNGSPAVLRYSPVGVADDVILPFPETWVVMLDELWDARWGHSHSIVFVSGLLDGYAAESSTDFPPSVWADNGFGDEINFACVKSLAAGCVEVDVDGLVLDEGDQGGVIVTADAQVDQDCLWAVLISGGVNEKESHSGYGKDLLNVYKKLRDCGYPSSQIFVYYKDGDSSLKLTLFGDNVVTGGAKRADIQAKIREICNNPKNKDKATFFIYATNHGSTSGIALWDYANEATGKKDGFGLNEVYSPAQFSGDTKNCMVCRVFVVLDLCYSGLFLPIATDGMHNKMAVYTAATATQWSWGTSSGGQYTTRFVEQDWSQDINDIHDAVATSMMNIQQYCYATEKRAFVREWLFFRVECDTNADCGTGQICTGRSTPQKREGMPGNGDVSLCTCWTPAPTPAPTPGPTPGPSPGPTPGPTPGSSTTAPSPSPSGSPTYVRGDPHFRTWGGQRFDFHGECDLLLLGSPNFGSGKGLTIHVRTQIAHSQTYSYVSSAALKIGKDVLELNAGGEWYFNGKMSDKKPKKISGYNVQYTDSDKGRHIFKIKLSVTQTIVMKEFKGVVSVDIGKANAENFGGSFGLSGSFPEGKMLARDGLTLLSDEVAFGKEWQVLETETMLFQTVRAPQHPKQCIMPDEVQMMDRRGRRLLESDITASKAEAACAHLTDKDEKEDCVYDVMAMLDLGVAEAGGLY